MQAWGQMYSASMVNDMCSQFTLPRLAVEMASSAFHAKQAIATWTVSSVSPSESYFHSIADQCEEELDIVLAIEHRD